LTTDDATEDLTMRKTDTACGAVGTAAGAGTAVLALLLSGCGAFSGGDGGADSGGRHDGSKAKAPTARLLGTVRGSSDAGSSAHSAYGFWADDGMFARTSGASVVGYRASDAERKWSLRLGGEVCAATPDSSGSGKVAVVYEGRPMDSAGERYCTEVAAVDLHSGKKVWHRERSRHEAAGAEDSVAIAGDTVAVPGGGSGTAWRLGDGKPLWKRKRGEHCGDESYAGGRDAGRLIAVRRCSGGHGDGAVSVEAEGVDPRTGRAKFRHRLGGDSVFRVLSADPVVLVGSARGEDGSHAVALTNDGRVRSRFPTRGDLSRLAVSHDTLYETGQERDVFENGNRIRGIDLDSGKVKGKAGFAKRMLRPIRMQGEKLLAYAEPPLESGRQGGAVVSVDPDTFEATEIVSNSGRSAKAERKAVSGNVDFRGGRLLLDVPAADGDTTPYATLVFGRK
jgi:hypothetical protein